MRFFLSLFMLSACNMHKWQGVYEGKNSAADFNLVLFNKNKTLEFYTQTGGFLSAKELGQWKIIAPRRIELNTNLLPEKLIAKTMSLESNNFSITIENSFDNIEMQDVEYIVYRVCDILKLFSQDYPYTNVTFPLFDKNEKCDVIKIELYYRKVLQGDYVFESQENNTVKFLCSINEDNYYYHHLVKEKFILKDDTLFSQLDKNFFYIKKKSLK